MKQREITHTSRASYLILLLLLLLPAPSPAAEPSTKELTTMGNEAFARGDFDKADSFYSEALLKEPDETSLLYNKANGLYKKEKYAEALALYEKAMQKGPSRKLLGSIFFNAGNTCLKLALKETEKAEPLAELRHKLALFERSFEMYRQALENERAVSIAEGRNVERAGLYARQNWALARELWTATWEQIRDLERKNLQLEDGIAGFVQAQMGLLPNLENIYLNSFSDDILMFNLKRLAEYQRDYREDILALKDLAAKEEEKIQTEIDNLKANQPKQPGTPGQQSQEPEAPENSELQDQLQKAVKIKDAIEQAVALGEWIEDGLSRGKPLEAWQNITKMIDLLHDLTSFIKETDPALSAYHALLSRLDSTELLLQQAAQLAEIKEQEDQVKIARQKRFKLAAAKNTAANTAVAKTTFYLAKMKEALAKRAEDPEDSPPANNGNALEQIFKEAFTNATFLAIDELLRQNQQLAAEISTANTSIQDMKATSVKELGTKANKSFLWYKQLQIPLEQSIVAVVQNLDELKDRLEGSNSAHEDNIQLEGHRQSGPGSDEVESILFQLQSIHQFLEKKKTTDPPDNQETKLQIVTKNIGDQAEKMAAAWTNYASLRNKENGTGEPGKLGAAADLLRRELLNTLLLFSPDLAISISFERSKKLQENLTALLPVTTDNSASILWKYKASATQAENLHKLLSRYFEEAQNALANQDNKEQQEAYSTALEKRKNSASLVQRFLDQGKLGASLLQEKRFQLTELLLKEMDESIEKAQLSFLEQPDDAEKALHLAIALQKKLEAQSRFANEALTVNGKANQVNIFFSASQKDINEIAILGKESIEQTIGMAEVPTHGQAQPQANTGQSGGGQADPGQLKTAIEKIDAAQKHMETIKSFMAAGEFHNTFEKHQEIVALLQEALDLLKNKDKQDGEENKEEQQQEGDQENQDQNEGQGQDDQGSQGEKRPQKPLELSASEARQLLEQLNKQDERQQDIQAAPGKKSFNTPRPW